MFFFFLIFICHINAHLRWSEIIHILEDSNDGEDEVAVGDFFHQPLDEVWLDDDDLEEAVGDFLYSKLQDLYHKRFDSIDDSSDFEEIAVGNSDSSEIGATERLISRKLEGLGIGDLYADDDSTESDEDDEEYYNEDEDGERSESEIGYSELDGRYENAADYDDSEAGESSRKKSEAELGEEEDAYLASDINTKEREVSASDLDFDEDESTDTYESANGEDAYKTDSDFDESSAADMQDEAGTNADTGVEGGVANGVPDAEPDHTFLGADDTVADPQFATFASRFRSRTSASTSRKQKESPVKDSLPKKANEDTHEESPMSGDASKEAKLPESSEEGREDKVSDVTKVAKSAFEPTPSAPQEVKGIQVSQDDRGVSPDGRPMESDLSEQITADGRPMVFKSNPVVNDGVLSGEMRQLTPDGRPQPMASERVIVGDAKNSGWVYPNQAQQTPLSNASPFNNSPNPQISPQYSSASPQGFPPQPENSISQPYPPGSYQWPVPDQFQQSVGSRQVAGMPQASPVQEPPQSYQPYTNSLISGFQNTRPDVIRVSSNTLLFHASSRPPGNLLWEEERVGGANGPFEVSESPQNTYDELGRKSPATIMSFIPAKSLSLLKFTPKNLQILWPQIKRGRDARFHLWWHDFSMLGKKKNDEITCTMQNIFRIVFGIKGGLSKVMEANPSGGCHLNPMDDEGSFSIQRLPRKDFDEHAVKFLCNTQPSDGYYADPLPNFPYVKGSTRIVNAWKDHEVKLGASFNPSQQSASKMYICDTNNLRNHQMFAMTLQQPGNIQSPYFSHKCADSFARQNVKVSASGGVNPKNVLHIDNSQWVSRQIASPWIQLDYGPKMAYADEVVLELTGGFGGIIQGSADGQSFSQPLAIINDMPSIGNVRRTFRAPLNDKTFQYFRFRGNGPMRVNRIKFICNSYRLGGKVEGQTGEVVVEAYWAGKDSEHVVQTVVKPWQTEWTFDRSFDYLTKYKIRIASHPEGQTCIVNNPTGKITTEVDDIYIVCSECVCSGKEFKNSGGASCNSVYQDRAWCYVESGICADEEPSKALKGYAWSFNACSDKLVMSSNQIASGGSVQPTFISNSGLNGFT